MGRNRVENPLRKLAATMASAAIAVSGLMVAPVAYETIIKPCIPGQDMTPGIWYKVCDPDTGDPIKDAFIKIPRSGPGR